MTTLTHQQRLAKEREIKEMVDAGMSLSEIARSTGTTSQSVHKFVRIRGWQTTGMKELEDANRKKAQKRVEAAERREARKAMKKEAVDRG